MSAQSMLEQLLKSGLGLLNGGPAGKPGAARDWSQLATGGAVGGALGLLLGSKRGRRLGGSALKYGSVAALGYAAYRIYNDWQAQQTQQAQPTAGAQPRSEPPVLPAPELELHSRAMLKAMIAAAKADGHVDERERALIEARLQDGAADPQDRAWFEQELRRPLDPAEVAQLAGSPALATEIYLASLLVADETSFMERAYLDELARQLKLPESLKQALEAQAAEPDQR